MSSDGVVIEVTGLGKRYEMYATPRDRLKQMLLPRVHDWWSRGVGRRGSRPQFYRDFWALRDVHMNVRTGETLGVIGRNGSGKSTLLQIVAGTLAPTTGRAVTRGRVAALLELGSGFNPEFTGRENVRLACTILGLSEQEAADRFDDIAAFADIGEFIDQPVKTYSSGMFLRLAFAVQAHIDASVVLIDEALAVGDVFFRQKCYRRLERLRDQGAAVLLVSHSMPDVEQLCDRAIVLDAGAVVFDGASGEAAKRYYLLYQNAPPAPASVAPGRSDGAANEAVADLPAEAHFDLAKRPQVTSGAARCVAVALTDARGDPCRHFRQSDAAVFHYEFELLRDIGVPIGGLTISNDRGIIVHGKNFWQVEGEIPARIGAGDRLHFRHEVALDLAPGEYVFEVGLASVSPATWRDRAFISHEAMDGLHERHCHLAAVGSFAVGYAVGDNGVPFLTHHGVADLRGGISLVVAPGART